MGIDESDPNNYELSNDGIDITERLNVDFRLDSGTEIPLVLCNMFEGESRLMQ